MKIISAICKYTFRTLSDAMYNHEIRKAPKTAYRATGEEMKNSNRRAKHINGRKTYVRNLANAKTTATQKRERREKFISEMF